MVSMFLNVALKATANQGAKVEFNANTYNAESVKVIIGAVLDSAKKAAKSSKKA